MFRFCNYSIRTTQQCPLPLCSCDYYCTEVCENSHNNKLKSMLAKHTDLSNILWFKKEKHHSSSQNAISDQIRSHKRSRNFPSLCNSSLNWLFLHPHAFWKVKSFIKTQTVGAPTRKTKNPFLSQSDRTSPYGPLWPSKWWRVGVLFSSYLQGWGEWTLLSVLSCFLLSNKPASNPSEREWKVKEAGMCKHQS